MRQVRVGDSTNEGARRPSGAGREKDTAGDQRTPHGVDGQGTYQVGRTKGKPASSARIAASIEVGCRAQEIQHESTSV